MEDRRKCHRRRTFLGGRIAFRARSATTDCLIRNLSPTGVQLEFAGSVIPPHEVDLWILSRGESRRGRLVWNDAGRAGFQTDPPGSDMILSVETARLIRKLKADRERLTRRLAMLCGPL